MVCKWFYFLVWAWRQTSVTWPKWAEIPLLCEPQGAWVPGTPFYCTRVSRNLHSQTVTAWDLLTTSPIHPSMETAVGTGELGVLCHSTWNCSSPCPATFLWLMCADQMPWAQLKPNWAEEESPALACVWAVPSTWSFGECWGVPSPV